MIVLVLPTITEHWTKTNTWWQEHVSLYKDMWVSITAFDCEREGENRIKARMLRNIHHGHGRALLNVVPTVDWSTGQGSTFVFRLYFTDTMWILGKIYLAHFGPGVNNLQDLCPQI